MLTPPDVAADMTALAQSCRAWEAAQGQLFIAQQAAQMQRPVVVCEVVLDHHIPVIIGGMYGFAAAIIVCFAFAALKRLGKRVWAFAKAA
jgi:hypothetical protein